MKLKFSDLDLLNFSKCNLLDLAEPEPEYLAAYQTAKWVLLRSADELPITKQIITTKFETNYKTHFETFDGPKYWKGIKLGRRFITKLFRLLLKYEVLQPIQIYQHEIIIGEYAVIQKKTLSEKPLVLIFHANRPLYYLYPDVSSQVKWLHSTFNYLDIGIYNFAMFRGDDWKYKDLNESLINDWINAILYQISSAKYYISPGSHCLVCLSKKCLKGIKT